MTREPEPILADVLIVDDDEATRRILRRIVEAEGYVVREAVDATEAIERISESTPAVALCDVHLPGANGLWLADEIRHLAPATAIALVTGDGEIPPSESLRKAVVGYVLKPVGRDELLQIVEDGMRWCATETPKIAARPAPRQLAEGAVCVIAAGEARRA